MSRPFTFFMLLKANAPWHALGRSARDSLQDDTLMQVCANYPSTRFRCYDATAFHARCTDVVVWETTDVAEYHLALDALRDTAFFRPPYFDMVDVIPTVPDGWREFEWSASSASMAW